MDVYIVHFYCSIWPGGISGVSSCRKSDFLHSNESTPYLHVSGHVHQCIACYRAQPHWMKNTINRDDWISLIVISTCKIIDHARFFRYRICTFKICRCLAKVSQLIFVILTWQKKKTFFMRNSIGSRDVGK